MNWTLVIPAAALAVTALACLASGDIQEGMQWLAMAALVFYGRGQHGPADPDYTPQPPSPPKDNPHV